MEKVEENSLINSTPDVVNKPNETVKDPTSVAEKSSSACHESNGNVNSNCPDNTKTMEEVVLVENVVNDCLESEKLNSLSKSSSNDTDLVKTAEPQLDGQKVIEETSNNLQTYNQLEELLPELSEEVVVTVVVDESEDNVTLDNNAIVESTVEVSNTEMNLLNDEVKFETEVLVEQNENNGKIIHHNEIDSTNNILNDLSHNIEFSEALRSSNVSEVIIENNISNTREEVFNKEELLDILQGNDIEPSNQVDEEQITNSKIIEAQIALKQLTRLQARKGKNSSNQKVKKPEKKLPINEKKVEGEVLNDDKKVIAGAIEARKKRNSSNQKVKKHDRKISGNENKMESNTINDEKTEVTDILSDEKEEVNASNEKKVEKKGEIPLKSKEPQKKAEESNQKPEVGNIVKVIVKDWDDDEPNPADSSSDQSQSEKVLEESENLLNASEELKEAQKQVISPDELMNQTSQDSTTSEDQIQNCEKGPDGDPPRRVSRVIKKKVIFDPDNPDTFTKSKTPSKSKEIRDTQEQTSTKKIKVEQTVQRSKSKSPMSKLQWKKPSLKTSKQCKRLSEVDRLLMDEGAVNMIYQLTPEAPKGKKNMRTKAEFIKKIQSSTPDGNEMKFRERKKETMKYEDGEPKKILGGRHRVSLSSSVKSPAVSEDFETHSADDSIIYRRHSSSSYSSSCMSPRRLSDVEAMGLSNSLHAAQHASENQNIPKLHSSSKKKEGEPSNAFMSDSQNASGEIINKNDCLSIKEKLNSKLSLALNKRKRESPKTEKPLKHKKLSRDDISQPNIQFNFISVNIERRLATITVKKTDLKISIEVLKELEVALNVIDSRDDISMTVISSLCGRLCSSLDLSVLLEEDKEARRAKARELAENIRLLCNAMVCHSKLLWYGVNGRCMGVTVALACLADVALAADSSSFSLAAALPASAAIASNWRGISPNLVNDLVVFGRRISASEALQGGLISRTLWPERFDEQVHNMAKDIAAQPLQTVLLKKKLLNLQRSNEAVSLLSCLERERDLLVEYWTSVEGQEILRATLDAA